MSRFRKGIGLGVFIAAIGIVLRPTAVGVRLEEDFALGWLFAIRGPVEPPPAVVVVSIDKSSADRLGLTTANWPPPRQIHASVIRSLSRHRVSAIMMDVFFKVHRTPVEDDDLADAIAASGNVALFEWVDRAPVPRGGEIVQTRSPIEQLRDAAIATAAFPLPRARPSDTFGPSSTPRPKRCRRCRQLLCKSMRYLISVGLPHCSG